MGTRHAYLIIAHGQFDVLKCLVQALDDYRNDIYIHFDKKVRTVPLINVSKSTLFVLTERIDVRWGSYTQIQVEMLLFKYAYDIQQERGVNYQYFHLLSGQDMPIKSQDYIHDFFNNNSGKEFIGIFQGDISHELLKKVRCYHPFDKKFSKKRHIDLVSLIRAIAVRFQCLFGGIRNKDIELIRGTNWVSVTEGFVRFLLSKRAEICHRYCYTFCADEVYKHTLCWNSEFKERLYNSTDEAKGCMRVINWKVSKDKSWLPSFTADDYPVLAASSALFARKFDEKNIDVVYRLLQDIAD